MPTALSMAFWKRRSRGSFAPSSDDRVAVVYLGQHPVGNTGLDDASAALDTLYRNHKDGKGQSRRVTVEVIVNGLLINKMKGFSPASESSASSDSRILLAAVKMFFGATDPARPRIFFVVKESDDDKDAHPVDNYECHAFLCESPAAAHALALQLVEVFNNAGDPATKLAYRRSFDYAMTRSNRQQNREKGLIRSQSFNLPRSRGRQEAVSTIKITMNVEHSVQPSLTEANNNSEIARIIAKRESERSPRSGAAEGSDSPAAGRSRRSASSRGDTGGVDMIPEEGIDDKSTHVPVLAFNPSQPGSSPSKLLRESQLSTVKEQSPSSSPKQSPKERKMAAKADDTKENQQVDESNLTDKANKRKSVRFADNDVVI